MWYVQKSHLCLYVTDLLLLLLNELININPVVEKFFEDVLVMDKDENVKKNRQILLTLLKQKYEILADFSKL